MVMPQHLIRAAILTGYIDVARSVGLDPYRLLKGAGLQRVDLSDADSLIPVADVMEILERTAEAGNVYDFGLRMAAQRSLAHLGPVGVVAREEPTLRDAIRLFERYFRLRTELLVLGLEEHGDVTSLEVKLLIATKGSIRQLTELIVGVVFRTLKALAGPEWTPESVSLSHTRPQRDTMHHVFFGAHTQFGGMFDGLVLRTRDLDAPISTADPVMALYVGRYLRELMNQPLNAIEGTVRQMVFTLLPSGRCTGELVANHLGIDRRTLSRRLAARKTSFSDIHDDVRTELARRHLKGEGRSLAETAQLLGFAGQPEFSRWFKARFGQSPARWRKAP